MRQYNPFIVFPAVVLVAFSLYNFSSFISSAPLRVLMGEDAVDIAAMDAAEGLSPGSLGDFEKELEEVKEENRALDTSLSAVEDTLRKYLSKISMNQKNELLEEIAGGKSYFKNAKKYVRESYTFWSSDFHISPIADLKDLFEPMGMKIIDKSLSGHCHLKQTCATDLRVLSKDNGIDLGRCPNQLRRDFFNAYKDDPQMKSVDAFLCHHACGLCEVFMPFNKSLIVIASTRYEIGRHSASRWSSWNANLRKIAANPRNIVAANNLYDAEYIKYFTGLKEVPVLPNYCGYTLVTYAPSRKEVLVGPGRGIHDGLFRELKAAGQGRGVEFARIRDLYPHFEYADLVKHKAIVLIPYQVSIMSIFEYYRMAIPIFAPSPKLLAKWQVQHRVMGERTWDGVFGHPSDHSAIGPAPGVSTPHDPNNEKDEAAIQHWISLADFYVWPHIVTFESWEDLLNKMQDTDLSIQSNLIRTHNERMKEELKQQWQDIFRTLFQGQPPAAQVPREQIQDFDESMAALYNVKVHGACEGDTHL